VLPNLLQFSAQDSNSSKLAGRDRKFLADQAVRKAAQEFWNIAAPKPIKEIANFVNKEVLSGKTNKPKPVPAKPKPKPAPVIAPGQVLQPGKQMPPKKGNGNGKGKTGYVTAPVARAKANRKEAMISRMLEGGRVMELTREEYVRDIFQTAASTFELDTVPIDITSFPWSKQYGGLFENYTFDQLEFEYVPLQASSISGFVLFAPDYDPADTHTTTLGKGDLLAMDDARDGNAWLGMIMRCSAGNLKKRQMLYTGTVAAATIPAQLRQHQVGNLFIGKNTSATSGSVIGELWVRYVVRYFTPQIVPIKSGENDDLADSARCTGTSNAAPFGAANTYAEGGIPATFSSAGTTTSVTTFTFTQPWSGYVTGWLSTAAGIASITPTGTATSAEIFEDSSSLSWFAWIDANQAQTFIVTIANTDISASSFIFVRGSDRRA